MVFFLFFFYRRIRFVEICLSGIYVYRRKIVRFHCVCLCHRARSIWVKKFSSMWICTLINHAALTNRNTANKNVHTYTIYRNSKLKNKKKTQIWIVLFTPRYVSESSKYVLSTFNDSDRVSFPITPTVKGKASPAMSGGAVTQHPTIAASNSRR